MTKPESEWMPHNGEINKERMRDTELFGSYTPQFRLRNLIRRTAIKAQIEREESHKLDWQWHQREAEERLDDIDKKIVALRAELAELERGDAT